MTKLYAHAPGIPFCLSASTFLKGEKFYPVCPYRVTDSTGKSYETQWSLVSETIDGIQVEFNADIEDSLSGPQVFTLTSGSSTKSRPDTDLSFRPLLDQIKIRFHLQDDTTYDVPVTFPLHINTRLGPARWTLTNHVAHQYGGIHGFLDIKTHAKSWGLDLNFHNGLMPPKGKFYFKAIELLLPPGFDFTESLNYGTRTGTYLVRPEPTGHVLPQRRQFSRRLQIHKVGELPTHHLVGQGFGNYFQGGYLPAGYEIGHLTNAASKLQGEINSAQNKFDNALPELTNGPQPPHRLWQSQNVQYGGMTGGQDIESIPDPEIADVRDPQALEMLMQRQLRYHNRQMGPIMEASGYPSMCESYMNADTTIPWQMFSNGFQLSGGKPKEGPFTFSKAMPNSGSCAYETELMNWAPLDHQHLRRLTKHDQELVWFMNDGLSKLYCLQDAELQRMAYWHGKGGRLDIATKPQGGGIDEGREFAWMLDCVSFAASLNIGFEHKQALMAWVNNAAAIAKKVQLPSGWVNVRKGGKAITDPPLSSQYWGGQAFETCFVVHALLTAFKVTGSVDAETALLNLLKSCWEYAWVPGSKGMWTKVATHAKQPDGSFQLLQSHPTLSGNGTESYNVGAIPGIAWKMLELHPSSGLRPDLMFIAHQGATSLQDALNKAMAANNSTWPHLANTIALAQKYLNGVQE